MPLKLGVGDWVATELNYKTQFLSAKGLSFQNSDVVAVWGDSISNQLYFSDTVSATYTLTQLRTAEYNAFTYAGFISTNVRDAIVEAANKGKSAGRYTINFGYGGQGKGQWFEIFKGLSSDTSPFVVPLSSTIKEVTASFKPGSSPNGTVSIYKNMTLSASFAIAAETFLISGLTISAAVGDKISVRGEPSSTTLSEPLVLIFFSVN